MQCNWSGIFLFPFNSPIDGSIDNYCIRFRHFSLTIDFQLNNQWIAKLNSSLTFPSEKFTFFIVPGCNLKWEDVRLSCPLKFISGKLINFESGKFPRIVLAGRLRPEIIFDKTKPTSFATGTGKYRTQDTIVTKLEFQAGHRLVLPSGWGGRRVWPFRRREVTGQETRPQVSSGRSPLRNAWAPGKNSSHPCTGHSQLFIQLFFEYSSRRWTLLEPSFERVLSPARCDISETTFD